MTINQIEEACRKRLEELTGLRDRADKNYTDNARQMRLENLDKEKKILELICQVFDSHHEEMPSPLSVRPHRPGDMRIQRLQRYQSVPDWKEHCKDEREIRIVSAYIEGVSIVDIARQEQISSNRAGQILDHAARRCYWAEHQRDEAQY